MTDGQALAVCSSRDLVFEQVYLLGRIGDNKQALSLIIDRLGDVRRVCSALSPRLTRLRPSILRESSRTTSCGRTS